LNARRASTRSWGDRLRGLLLGDGHSTTALLVVLAVVAGVGAGASVSVGAWWMGWAALIVVVGGYVVLRSPLASLVVVFGIITLLPFGTLPVKIALTPTLLELMLAVLLGVWVLRLLAVPEFDLRATLLGGMVLLFLGFTIFSLIIGANGRPDNLTLHNYLKFALGVLAYFSVLNVVRTRDDMRWAMRALLVGGTGAALVGLGLFALNDDTALRLLVALGRLGYPTSGRVLRYVNDDPDGVERAIGTSVDPNSFGGMLALVCACAMAQVWAKRPVLPRPSIIASVGLLGVCIFLTQSRAALGALVVALMFLATVRERRLWFVIVGGGIAAFVALFVFGLGEQWAERIVEGVQFRDQANQMRLAEFRNAIEIIERYPVFGVGFGTGPELGLITGVSSIYLAMGQRIGLVGLVSFLVMMAVFFWQTFRASSMLDEERHSWLLGVQAALVAALATGLLDHYYFNIEFSHMVALFWSVVGLGSAALLIGQPAAPPVGEGTRDGRDAVYA
jgi:polysaccharide biosynthesis protein PslJ